MIRALCKASFALLLCLSAVGCANRVILLRPLNADDVELENQAGPQFSWAAEKPVTSPRMEYKVTVARSQNFGSSSVVYEAKTEKTSHSIPAEEGWLPGGADYFWKVEGVARTLEGDIDDTLECKNPRSFSLAKRTVVQIEVKVPPKEEVENATVSIGDEEFNTNTSLEMENGETRVLSISGTVEGEVIRAAGTISVVGVNESTKFGKIIVDGLNAAFLKSISAGNVGKMNYTLGKDEIVAIKLGSRS
ncbi:MAG: hypothetical protein AAF517_17065 [Planctomycetota bacterium]